MKALRESQQSEPAARNEQQKPLQAKRSGGVFAAMFQCELAKEV
ncbi:hypothetical protein L861_19810 [Litchfieldella anticariensis FP35 = DSM 16096]|uniref:Uncharacterized protein n=1 Tax=Litchfieldella anticariensis (strain DSM 16096 / CECT 5854 / CIP 108499 / LMG 22089 / FP35) TaxID=1121939 RepID=S2KIY0_LITA3|nr:hypothetical protein L861_19810 [Halomonas anticariensis FP35 = DSM 16096]